MPQSSARLAAVICLISILFMGAVGAATFNSADGPINVAAAAVCGNAATVYPSQINVAGLSGTVSTITVGINSIQSNDGTGRFSPAGLAFLLVAPSGQALVIMSGSGARTDNTTVSLTIDDNAAGFGPANTPGGAWTNGAVYKPTGRANPSCSSGPVFPATAPTSFSEAGPDRGSATLGGIFNGVTANGAWKLFVAGEMNSHAATIASWTLNLTASATNAPTATSLVSSLNPSFTSAPGNSVTFTATVTSSGNPVTLGTVNFTSNGTTLPGCGAAALNGSGQAQCAASFASEGSFNITASYSGATGFGSSGNSLTQTVNNHSTQTGNQFCNPGAIAVPKPPLTGTPSGDPSNPYPSEIFVGALTGTVSHLQVSFTGVAHAENNDIDMVLVAPDGAHKLVLWSDVGGPNSTAGSPVNITLDDAAGSPLPTSGQLSSGSFRPTAVNDGAGDMFPGVTLPAQPAPGNAVWAPPYGSGSLGTAFNGINPNGTWTLYVVDDALGFTGTIGGGWCLNFSTSNNEPTTTTLQSSKQPAFLGDNVTITATVQDANPPHGPATGSVTFTDENGNALATNVALVNGQASFSKNNFSEGTHTITAVFNPAGNFAFSSGTFAQEIDNHTTVSGTQYCNPNTGGLSIPRNGVNVGAAMPYPTHVFVGTAVDPNSVPLAGTINKVTVSLTGFSFNDPDNALQSLLIGPIGTAADSLDFFSRTGGTPTVSNLNLVFDDAAASNISTSTSLTSGTWKPTSTQIGNAYPNPAPPGPYNYAAPAGAATLGSVYANSNGNGTWSLYFVEAVGSANAGSITGPICLNFTENPPDLSIAKTHTGHFRQGQTAAQYTIVVTNNGPGPTGSANPATVTDTLPAGLTATSIAGAGWSCTLGTLTCTRADSTGAGTSYPPITLTVNVAATAAASVTNTASVAGSGDNTPGNNTSSDPTIVDQVADLTITKTHTGNFKQGDTADSYTITVTNSGQGATLGTTTVTDALPAGLTATDIAGIGWSCTLGTLTCSRSDVLAAGASYPAITLTVSVANNAPASVTNTATVSGGGELNTANDTASDPTMVVQVPDLTITKTHASNFFQGETAANYTITVTNSGAGPVVAGNTVTVADTLPAGLAATAIAGAGWNCALNTLTCTRADALAAGASYAAITLTVSVANNAPASVTNTATVSGGGEVNTNNDTANDVTTINAGADLTISKSHTSTFTQGDTGRTYTLVVNNIGATASSGTITVTDTLPAGLTATALSGSGWTCNTGTLTCTSSATIAAGGASTPITLTVNVAGNATSPQVNQAAVSGGGDVNPNNNTATDSTVITQLPDLTIVKMHNGNFSQGQSGAAYTIVVTNSGAGPTSGAVTVTDTLPAGLTATAISGGGWSCALNTLTCTRNDVLAAGASYPAITLTVNVSATAGPSVTNTATVSGGGETNTGNDTANDVTTIGGGADLTITKTHSGNFRQGDAADTYTITVTNSGAAATNGGTVTVADTLPAGLTATAISGAGWSCALNTLTCTRTDVLAAGASYPAISLTVSVANNAPASVTNTATVSGGGDVNPNNNTANDVTNVTAAADLTVSKTHPGNFSQGQQGAAYTITVTNLGPGATTGTVTVTDTLPSGLTATAISGTGWSCALNTLTCTRTDVLAGGASYPAITLTVNVSATAGPSVTNTATVSGGGELNTANDTANDATAITAGADLTITKTHQGNFSQGQQGAFYTITVSNSGASATNGSTVTVTDALPSGLTATAISGTGWSCALNTLTCTRTGALASGASYPAILLTVNVANNAPASVTNTATVSGGGDVNPNNNTANDVTSIGAVADLTIVKTHSGNFTAGQTGATYTIVASNAGTGVTSGAVNVTDTLPTGLTATAISGAGWSCALNTLTCTRVDPLSPGASYPAITLTVNVAQNAPATVTNIAVVSGGGENNANNDTATDMTTIVQTTPVTVGTSPAGLTFAVDGTPYTSAQSFNWVIGSQHTISTTTPQTLSGTNYVFNSWSDGGAISHTVTASTGVASYTAAFDGQTSLDGVVFSKSGPANARVWTIQVTDTGLAPALGTAITGFTLTDRSGANACFPTVVTPLPAVVGNLNPGQAGTVPVTIDFTGCSNTARFAVTIHLSANHGAASGTIVRGNDFR